MNKIIKGLMFEETCSFCPEQYEVFKGKKQVGYVRLRHGELRVDCPDCGGNTIFRYDFEEEGDGLKGSFDDEKERKKYLSIVANKINKFLKKEK